MIIIDTDILIEIFDKKSKVGEEAYRKIVDSGEDFSITAINLHELLYGLMKYKKQAEQISALPVLAYTRTDAELSAELENEAEAKGKKVMRTDSMIAAIAIDNCATLYTNNTRHFEIFQSLGLKLF